MNDTQRTQLIWSTDFQLHDTGDHPERPARILALEQALSGAGMFANRQVHDPVPATLESILAVHSDLLIERVRRTAANGGAWMDQDTYVSGASYDIALLAAGAAIQAVDLVMSGDASRAFSLGRPPGHHAEPNRAMGFCLFNNVAVAARHAIEQHGLSRVAVIDWDVHHGNGTQAIFWEDPSVLFVSLHQFPFYPGSGAQSERGEGRGEGYTLNVPLPAGSENDVYLTAMQEIVVPALDAYQPELLLISAGFDAHRSDPLAQMNLTTDCFADFARLMQGVATRWSDGRVALVLEGGYNLQALGESVVAVIRTLDGDTEVTGVDIQER
jgi:acetoin utilization deacetylase AcuC-like enzyme